MHSDQVSAEYISGAFDKFLFNFQTTWFARVYYYNFIAYKQNSNTVDSPNDT